jgi:hypothetical protein
MVSAKKQRTYSWRHEWEASVSVEDADRSGNKEAAASHRDFAEEKPFAGISMSLLEIGRAIGHDPKHVGHALAQLFYSQFVFLVIRTP